MAAIYERLPNSDIENSNIPSLSNHHNVNGSSSSSSSSSSLKESTTCRSNFDANHLDDTLILTTDEILGRSIATIRHEQAVPITRPPTKPRDGWFGLAFLSHFVVVIVIFLIEDKALSSSFDLYYGKDLRVGSWASLLMMVTLVGSFVGAFLCLLISNSDTRRRLFQYSIITSIIFQICLGNILLLVHSTFSFLGIFFLFSAMADSYRYVAALKTMNFTCALVQMSLDIGQVYGLSLFFACASIVIFQSCLLLWWGAFFVGILSQIKVGFTATIYMMVLMAFSFYWITQFFNGFMSYIVGGCILWYFLREEEQELNPRQRVLLLMQCAFTTSFGSICKGAFFSPLAQSVITLESWSNDRSQITTMNCNGKNFVRCLIGPFSQQALRYNRLAYCLIATYGRTFCRAAEDQVIHHPDALRISTEDHAYYTLTAVATALAGIISIIFGLVADRNEGTSWPIFVLVNFMLTYSGIALVIQTYRSAVDALIVAFAEKPDRFADENQIVFLRFLRFTESALQSP
jgi:hypothetical protein